MATWLGIPWWLWLIIAILLLILLCLLIWTLLTCFFLKRKKIHAKKINETNKTNQFLTAKTCDNKIDQKNLNSASSDERCYKMINGLNNSIQEEKVQNNIATTKSLGKTMGDYSLLKKNYKITSCLSLFLFKKKNSQSNNSSFYNFINFFQIRFFYNKTILRLSSFLLIYSYILYEKKTVLIFY